LDNKRKVIVMDCCCMRKRSEKSIDHLLLHCEVARDFFFFLIGNSNLFIEKRYGAQPLYTGSIQESP
jgi:hypothetical protein